MISKEELRAMLADPESDRVERTVATDKLAQAVTAFANDFSDRKSPGYLVIGARDNGTPSGLPVTDRLLQNLAGLRSDGNIQPLPLINVARFDFPDGSVAVVEVWPSDLPPVRYEGRVWIRVGPRRAIATEQEEHRLTEKRVARARTFDALPCIGSGIDTLALELFRFNYLTQVVDAETLEENHRTIPQQLASLRFYDSQRECPTNAGILLFGKNPLEWLPGAYIQYLSLDGVGYAGDVIEERTISGDLLTVLRELDSLASSIVEERPVPDSTLREGSVSSFPKVAIRELLMNAVMHRSYESTAPVRFYRFSDRIEIQSPGGLFGEASAENFPSQNSYRSPIIAEAMKALGFVNRFGRGVYRAQEALKRNGSRPADFHFDHGYVRATIWRRS